MDKIIKLLPEERVRRKPAVIFGDDGIEGSKRVFIDILKILLAEVHHGFCSRIDITLYKDGRIDLTTNGRGFYIGSDDQWKDIFLVLPVKSPYTFLLDENVFSLYEENTDALTKEERRFYDDLSLPCIQYVSKHMACTIYRDGRMHELHFKRGIPTSVVSSECDKQKQGMHINFMIDPEVFHNQHILPPDYVVNIARIAATRLPVLLGVKVESTEGWDEYFFGSGLEDSSTQEDRE